MTPKQYKKTREELGLSQRKAAKVLGRTRQTIMNRENGTSPILAEAEFALLYLKTREAK